MKRIKIFAGITGFLTLGFIAGKLTNKKEVKTETKDIYIGKLVVDANDSENRLPNVYLEFFVQPDQLLDLDEAKVQITTIRDVSH